MSERLIDGKRPVTVKGRIGESDMCRLYPILAGIHSSAEADVLSAQEIYEGGIPAGADRADLGLPIGFEFVRDQLEF
jgi:hypothetical protein